MKRVDFCPRCGQPALQHCSSPTCTWFTCRNGECRAYGVDAGRWTRREVRAA